tara:strand:+ start:662 stop:889 length:228 start_codon:yes stop_codon:yes gene_type:complete
MILRNSNMSNKPAYLDDFISMIIDAITQCEDNDKQQCVLHVADDGSKYIVERMLESMDLKPSVRDRITVEKVTVH